MVGKYYIRRRGYSYSTAGVFGGHALQHTGTGGCLCGCFIDIIYTVGNQSGTLITENGVFVKRITLGSLLIADKIVGEEQLQKAYLEQEKTGEPLRRILIRQGLATEADILATLSTRLGIPVEPLTTRTIDAAVAELIPAKLAYRHLMAPLSREGNTLTIAVADPFDVRAFDEVRLITECDLIPVLAAEAEIVKALKRIYGVGAETVEQLLASSDQPAVAAASVVVQPAEDTSIISFVNQIIREACHDRATDIHIEPFEDDLIIRYRIDGVLHQIPTPASLKRFQPEIISRIKIMAEMNIAEKRLPQDGRILFAVDGEHVDLRVSTLPILHGESIDLRILPRSQMFMSLEQLGLPPDHLEKMERLITRPHGIILVTGPTGNGKTTTLYACLSKINSVDKKIITVEDPVEYQLKGINQVPVHARIGLTFANGLRSILRQDPDVIMVGEIRDQETAEIAIRASLTGHLVFSTLHTNDAPGAVTRLIDMGIEPYLVSSSIEAILAQRLIRLLCPACKVEHRPDAAVLTRLRFPLEPGDRIFKAGAGCEQCRHTGYKGRTGIYEFVLMDDDMRRISLEKTSSGNLKKEAMRKGMRTLRDDGWRKVKQGVTGIDEVIRVTQEE